MKTVEVVIRIPKSRLEELHKIWNSLFATTMLNDDEIAILSGTVLPKGHGDLVECGKVVDIVTEYVPDDDGSVGNTNLEDLLYEVENMERVIEADKEVDDGRENG